MSASKQAVDQVQHCLDQLIPSLLQELASLRSSHSTSTLLHPKLVFDQLVPLSSSDTIKQAFYITSPDQQDELQQARLRNLCLEYSSNQLRQLVLQVVQPCSSSFVSDQDEFPDLVSTTLFDRLDVILSLSLQGYIDPTLPLTLIEELIEMNTISTCSVLFSYTESRVHQLTVDLHPTRGKGLVFLRMSNELLRRLSKPSQKHTVFAGRILSLLASVFPLGERSGVNLRGDFNIDNKTTLEEPTEQDQTSQPIDTDQATSQDPTKIEQQLQESDSDTIFRPDDEFYRLFWRMQRFFSNPPLLMGTSGQAGSVQSSRVGTPVHHSIQEGGNDDGGNEDQDPAPDGAKGPMAELRISTKKILSLFAAVAKREKELAGAAAAEGAKYGALRSNNQTQGAKRERITGYIAGQDTTTFQHRPKRYRPDIKDGLKNQHTNDQDEGEGGEETANHQAKDHFFPKYLTGRKLLDYQIRDTGFRRHILVQYLILFQYLLSFTTAVREKWQEWKNKALQSTFALGEADEQWIRSSWREIQALLREIPPEGRQFLDSVLEVLKREANWIRWKTESCPSIEKPPFSPQQIVDWAAARASLLKPPQTYPYALGTAALTELWQEGFPPPVPGTRKTEDDMGNEITITTDGLEELEFLPPIPSLKHYHTMIKREQMKLDMRKRQLGVDLSSVPVSMEDQQKLDKDDRAQGIVETIQSLAWRALRIASCDHLHLFNKMDLPENIDALIKAIDQEANPPPKPPIEATKEDDEGNKSNGTTEPNQDVETKLLPNNGSNGSDAELVPVTVPPVPDSPTSASASASVPVSVSVSVVPSDSEAIPSTAVSADKDVQMGEETTA